MSTLGQIYFDEHFAILSGMYGLVRPKDAIANYKLPVECAGLATYWRELLTAHLSNIEDYTHIVNLLPLSYRKMIDFSILKIPVVHVGFQEKLEMHRKKLTHGIKKIRGEFIRRTCEGMIADIRGFPGTHEILSDNVHTITIIPSEECYP